VLQQVDLYGLYFGEGIVAWEDSIFQLTWTSNLAFVYDKSSFELIRTFPYTTQGWGLTHDGHELIMSDGTSNLYFRNPVNFGETHRIQVTDGFTPVKLLNELEYIKGEVWANVYTSNLIARIDPQTGKVVAWVDLSGLLTKAGGGVPSLVRRQPEVLNGIAYDAVGDRIFVTGKRWPSLFEIELVPPANTPAMGPGSGMLLMTGTALALAKSIGRRNSHRFGSGNR